MTFEKIESFVEDLNEHFFLDGEVSWSDLVPKFDKILEHYSTSWIPDHKVSYSDSRTGLEIKHTSDARNKSVQKSKIAWILKDIDPLSFNTDCISLKGKYILQEFLEPYDIRLSNGDEKQAALTRIAEETMIGHITSFPQTLFVLRCSLGFEKSRNNPFLRKLRTYIDTFNGEEPFFEKDSKIINVHSDMMASTRCHVLLMAAFFFETWCDSDKVIPFEVLNEVTEYTLVSPFINGKKYKNMKSLYNQSICSASKIGTGIFPRWYAADLDRDTVAVTGFGESAVVENDHVYFDYIKDKLSESAAEMKSEGLVATEQVFSELVYASPSPAVMRQYSVMISLEALSGYTRSYAPISHVSQVTKEIEADANPPFASAIAMEWRLYTEWAHKEGLFVDYDEWRRKWPEILTSKSSGGRSVTLEYKLPSISGGDTIIRQRYTDKKSNFYTNPEWHLNSEVVKLGYTESNPGLAGVRYVTAYKATRAIFMEHTPTYLAEAPFAIPLAEYQSRRSKGFRGWGSSNDFTLGKEVGNVYIDHAPGIIASSLEMILCEGADFTAFDTHQSWAATRKPALDAIVDTLKSIGHGAYERPFGTWSGGLIELIQTIWSEAQKGNAYFLTTDKTPLPRLNQLQSGELMTINFNNFTNRAYMRHFINELARNQGISQTLRLLRVFFMGDDSMRFWRISDQNRYDVNMYSQFGMIARTAAAQDGLPLNELKSVLRLFYYEYLKKRAVYGYVVPLLHMQPFASENGGRVDSQIGEAIAYGSFLASYVARGGNHMLLKRIQAYTWNMRRGVRMKTFTALKKNSETSYFYFPFMLLYTPIEMKGCGQLPYSLLGASKDAVIAMDARDDIDLEKYIDCAGSVANIQIIDVKTKIGTKAINGSMTMIEYDDNGVATKVTPDPFRAGINYLTSTLLYPRVVAAHESVAKLYKNENVPKLNQGMFYPDLPTAMIKDTVKNAKHQRQAEANIRRDSGAAYKQAALSVRAGRLTKTIKNSFPWIYGIVYKWGDELDNWRGHTISPSACLDPEIYNVALKYGTTMHKDSLSINPNTVMDMIREDKKFRRDLRAETIFEYITHSSIIIFSDRIMNALIAMGLRSDIAAKIANLLGESDMAFSFRQNAKTFSLSDQFLPTLDLSIDGHKRVVDLKAFTENRMVYNLMMELGFLMSVTRGSVSAPRKLQITITAKAYHNMLTHLFGKEVHYSSNFNVDMFPKEVTL